MRAPPLPATVLGSGSHGFPTTADDAPTRAFDHGGTGFCAWRARGPGRLPRALHRRGRLRPQHRCFLIPGPEQDTHRTRYSSPEHFATSSSAHADAGASLLATRSVRRDGQATLAVSAASACKSRGHGQAQTTTCWPSISAPQRSDQPTCKTSMYNVHTPRKPAESGKSLGQPT